jgi:hypothetical protein
MTSPATRWRSPRSNARAARWMLGAVALGAIVAGAALRPAAAGDSGPAPAPAAAPPPPPAAAPPPATDAAAPLVLARFSTSYAHDGEHRARAFNVELGAEAVDGKTLAPGATFSFNDAVGERTAAFGFARSVVLRDGMLAEGVGGGACQVASTLHAAALLGGLEVVSRAPHSRPSAYIRMGLDATVALAAGSPPIDLKLRNSTRAPVVVRARAAGGVLEIWLETRGTTPPDVSVTSEIVDRSAFPRVVERDKRITDDSVRVKAFGIPGYRVRRTREIRAADGTVRRDVRIDVYPPTSEIVRVAPSFDESRLRLRSGSEASPAEDGAEPASGADEAPPKTAPSVVDAGAPRPALVQLRPSTRVVLDNASR